MYSKYKVVGMEAVMNFSEIMAYYSENQAVFNELKSNFRNIIPFVGAGMSIPVGYPSWGGALQQICNMIANEQKRQEISFEIEAGQYISVTNLLVNQIGNRRICNKLQQMFSATNLTENDYNKTAVALLPQLFPDTPVITTNFDRLLEVVYQNHNHNFENTILPYRQELAEAMNQRNLHTLVKLHGDVSDHAVEWNSIVFTDAQYQEAYSDNSHIITILKQFASSHMMLFLGCSLEQDFSVSLLKKISKNSIVHYAIIPCEKNRIDERLNNLAEGPNIHAIVYPEGKHDAVRVILEELLLELFPDKYRNLPYYHTQAIRNPNPFAYNAESIDFYGRSKEVQELQEFCSIKDFVSWWVITGPGGAGKSRLAYEFSKKMKIQGWDVYSIKQGQYDKLFSLSFPKDTLVIADYVQGYVQQLGTWLHNLTSIGYPRSGRVRVLILEREGTNLENASWCSHMMEDSYGFSENMLNYCYKRSFLQLKPLQKEDLQNIMVDYYRTATLGKELLIDEKNLLFDTLQNIDKSLMRPLFALFLTDAFADGYNPEHWDKTKALDILSRKEKNLRHARIRESFRNSERIDIIYRHFDMLWAVATIYDGISLGALKTQYPTIWNDFCTAVPTQLETDAIELLYAIGLWDEDIVGIQPLKPDLLGEYYVLKELQCRTQGKLKTILGDFSHSPVLSFTTRLVADYSEDIVQEDWIIENLLNFDSNTVSIQLQLFMLVGAMLPLFPNKKNELLQKQSEIYSKHPDIISLFQRLYENSSKNPDIASGYAKTLFSLLNQQNATEAKETVEKLKAIRAENPDIQAVTIIYAESLIKLYRKSNQTKNTETIQLLKYLTTENPDNDDLKSIYAFFMLDLLNEPDSVGVEDIISLLSSSYEEFPENEQIVTAYAVAAATLIYQQAPDVANNSIKVLQELHNRLPNNKAISFQYAQALFNLTCTRTVNINESIEILQLLYEENAECDEIAYAIAKELVNIIRMQSLQESKITIQLLHQLHTDRRNEERISIAYAKGLYNLIHMQNLEEVSDTINKLQKLNQENVGCHEILLIYAMGLVNMVVMQNLQDASKTINDLRKLCNEHLSFKDISIAYVKGLAILINKITPLNTSGINITLNQLPQIFVCNQEIGTVLSNILHNLVNDQALIASFESIRTLGTLSSEELGITAFTALYENCVHILGEDNS